MKYDSLCIQNKKFGCHVKKLGLFEKQRRQKWKFLENGQKATATTYVFMKRIFDHKEAVGHRSVIKLLAEGERHAWEFVFKYFISRKVITVKIFCAAYYMTKENQSLHNSESEIDLLELNGNESMKVWINIMNHIVCKMRKKKNWLMKSLGQKVKFLW